MSKRCRCPLCAPHAELDDRLAEIDRAAWRAARILLGCFCVLVGIMMVLA